MADYTYLKLVFCHLIMFLTLLGHFPSTLDAANSSQQAAHANKHALLIGINNYEGACLDAGKNITSLKGSKNDVNLIRDVLVERFEMPRRNIVMLTDEKTRQF